ncbi:MAG: hypothetical protein LBR76_05950, partial [Oscillospiraceae bacterium]|nr:hypothetical protein [Oscillospiraceae bacterium]
MKRDRDVIRQAQFSRYINKPRRGIRRCVKMPARSEKSFRTAMVGGFNRQDVLEYISSSAREHQTEVDAYRAGADKLRGERDALTARVNELSSQRDRADSLEA